MTINATDIRLLESERMSDATDGGGRRTSRVIPDGVAGNVFPKVSRVDSVYGRVNLRKVFGHVDTANLDMYAGAHFIVTDAPDNGRISVTAFSTASDFDTRVQARDRIESYVIAGPVSRMTLYGRQLLGSQAVLVYQRTTEPLPEIGDVYALSNEVGGTTTNQQFVRITDVSGEVRTLTDEGGDFTVLVVTLKIGAPLRYEFYGPATPQRQSASATATTGRVRSTTVADAARYFGIQPLSVAAAAGALDLTLASVYAPLVPTTQRETPLSLATIVGAQNMAASGALQPMAMIGVLTTSLSSFTFHLPRAVVPGTLTLQMQYSTSTAGVAVPSSGVIPAFDLIYFGAVSKSIYGGTVDAEAGTVTVTCTPNTNNINLYASWEPAVEVSQPAHTVAVPVTLATRGTVYAIPLLPIPAPGTLLLDYRALGKWYRLRDEGNGELVGGDTQYGTGTIDYINGAATVTLGALPDVGSSILMSWGSPVHYEVHTADAGGGAYQDFVLEHTPVKASTLSVGYVSNGTTYTLTADAYGALTGAGATGTLDRYTGAVHIEYAARLPDFDSTLAVAYTQAELAADQSASGGTLPSGAGDRTMVTVAPTSETTISIGSAVSPGTMMATNVSLEAPDGSLLLATLTGNNDGTVSISRGRYGTVVGTSVEYNMPYALDGTVVGSINNSTGEITLTGSVGFGALAWAAGTWSTGAASVTVPIRFKTGMSSTFWFVPGQVTLDAPGGGTIVVSVSGLVTVETARTASLSVDTDAHIKVDLTRTSTSAVVPGSVMFSAAGKTFVDRNGTLYSDLQTNGSGTPAGSLDYATGIATLAYWTRGAALSLAVNACLIKYGDWTATDVFFRTAGSPLRPASTYIQVTAADGALLTGTSDQNGNITGAAMVGKIEQTMGVVGVSFGAMVTAAGNEAEPWYDSGNVVAGMIFKPREVMPGTLRYSAVVLSNLPLNADILGLDPTRLPSDGRAPIYRPADVAVIHHTDGIDAGTPSAGTILDAGRTGLSAAWVEDSAKVKLDAALYTTDLAAGTVTMATPLDLAGYTPPLTMRHRIEEMGLLSDVQINGQVSLTAPLLRDYPLGSMLSSALLFGDLQARVTNVFEQSTWTSVWQDTAIGATPSAQYDDVNYPLEVLNNGAVTERWRINFTGTTAFQVIGQNLGVIATGSTSADLQPVNSLTGLPYFTLRAGGWGMGWSVGNQLRFDTLGATAPIWLARTVLPGATLEGDSFDAQLRGDVD